MARNFGGRSGTISDGSPCGGSSNLAVRPGSDVTDMDITTGARLLTVTIPKSSLLDVSGDGAEIVVVPAVGLTGAALSQYTTTLVCWDRSAGVSGIENWPQELARTRRIRLPSISVSLTEAVLVTPKNS